MRIKNGIVISNFREWLDENKCPHRLDGPATIYDNGDKCWYIHGIRHRIDGPAVHCMSGYKEWWYQGSKIDCCSQEEFEKHIKMKAFW